MVAHHQGKWGQEPRAETWGQGLKQGPWKDASYRLALSALPSLLSSINQDCLQFRGEQCPQWAGGWPLSHQSAIRKMPQKHAHGPLHSGRFFTCAFLSPGDSSFAKLTKKSYPAHLWDGRAAAEGHL